MLRSTPPDNKLQRQLALGWSSRETSATGTRAAGKMQSTKQQYSHSHVNEAISAVFHIVTTSIKQALGETIT